MVRVAPKGAKQRNGDPEQQMLHQVGRTFWRPLYWTSLGWSRILPLLHHNSDLQTFDDQLFNMARWRLAAGMEWRARSNKNGVCKVKCSIGTPVKTGRKIVDRRSTA